MARTSPFASPLQSAEAAGAPVRSPSAASPPTSADLPRTRRRLALPQRLQRVLHEHQAERLLQPLPAGRAEALALVERARPRLVARGEEAHAAVALARGGGQRGGEQVVRHPAAPPRRPHEQL